MIKTEKGKTVIIITRKREEITVKIKIYKKEKINVYHASISLYNDVVIYDDL